MSLPNLMSLTLVNQLSETPLTFSDATADLRAVYDACKAQGVTDAPTIVRYIRMLSRAECPLLLPQVLEQIRYDFEGVPDADEEEAEERATAILQHLGFPDDFRKAMEEAADAFRALHEGEQPYEDSNPFNDVVLPRPNLTHELPEWEKQEWEDKPAPVKASDPTGKLIGWVCFLTFIFIVGRLMADYVR